MNLDFSNCKTPEDVKKVFEQFNIPKERRTILNALKKAMEEREPTAND